MKKIALILPYFGKFKNYFPLWVESCKNNPTIDWLLFTDQTFNFAMPSNVIVKTMSFEQFKERLQQSFSFSIALPEPYKLCDFKPTFGLALHEELAGYDFWGHCDCDLIFGDIRHFVTEDLLNKYDKLFTRGHFCLYRNTPQVNAFFQTQRVVPYQPILQSSQNFSFDEWPGISMAWDLSGQPYYDGLVYDDIWSNLDGFRVTKENSGWGGPYHKQNDITQAKAYSKMKHIVYRYQSGKLERVFMYRGELHFAEVMYVHLQKRNMQLSDKLSREYASFIIAPNIFLPFSVAVSSDLLKTLSPDTLTKRNMITYTKFLLHNLLKK